MPQGTIIKPRTDYLRNQKDITENTYYEIDYIFRCMQMFGWIWYVANWEDKRQFLHNSNNNKAKLRKPCKQKRQLVRSSLDGLITSFVSKYCILLINFLFYLFYKYWLLKTPNCISLFLPTVANEPMIRGKEQTEKRSRHRGNYVVLVALESSYQGVSLLAPINYSSAKSYISWRPSSFAIYLNP